MKCAQQCFHFSLCQLPSTLEADCPYFRNYSESQEADDDFPFVISDEEEYIENKPKHCDDTIIFPQTIGDITFYSKQELYEWVLLQQNKMNGKNT
jgi:hypothetical protein